MGIAMDGDGGALVDDFVRYFARLVADEIRGRDVSLVSQATSPLGSRKHCAAVRRRITEHDAGERPISGASINGRRFLLTQEALAEELGTERGQPARESNRRPSVARAKARKGGEPDAEQSTYDAMMRRYRGSEQ
jgi:hypothetical protein